MWRRKRKRDARVKTATGVVTSCETAHGTGHVTRGLPRRRARTAARGPSAAAPRGRGGGRRRAGRAGLPGRGGPSRARRRGRGDRTSRAGRGAHLAGRRSGRRAGTTGAGRRPLRRRRRAPRARALSGRATRRCRRRSSRSARRWASAAVPPCGPWRLSIGVRAAPTRCRHAGARASCGCGRSQVGPPLVTGRRVRSSSSVPAPGGTFVGSPGWDAAFACRLARLGRCLGARSGASVTGAAVREPAQPARSAQSSFALLPPAWFLNRGLRGRVQSGMPGWDLVSPTHVASRPQPSALPVGSPEVDVNAHIGSRVERVCSFA